MSVCTSASTVPTIIVRIAITHSIGCQVQRASPNAT